MNERIAVRKPSRAHARTHTPQHQSKICLWIFAANAFVLDCCRMAITLRTVRMHVYADKTGRQRQVHLTMQLQLGLFFVQSMVFYSVCYYEKTVKMNWNKSSLLKHKHTHTCSCIDIFVPSLVMLIIIYKQLFFLLLPLFCVILLSTCTLHYNLLFSA